LSQEAERRLDQGREVRHTTSLKSKMRRRFRIAENENAACQHRGLQVNPEKPDWNRNMPSAMKPSKSLLVLALLVVLITGGCVHALNPFYHDKDVVFDPALVGEWCDDAHVGGSPTNRVTWTLAVAEGQAYEMKLGGLDGGKPLAMEFDVHLFRLDGQRFLDIFPTEAEAKKPSEPYGWLAFFRPTHTVVHLLKSEGRLVMRILDPKELEKNVENHPSATHFEKYTDRLLLTGSTRQLQHLLRESLRRTNWWGNGVELSRSPP